MWAAASISGTVEPSWRRKESVLFTGVAVAHACAMPGAIEASSATRSHLHDRLGAALLEEQLALHVWDDLAHHLFQDVVGRGGEGVGHVLLELEVVDSKTA
eukprot:2593086-Pyramimonas_sp.AAC.1